MSDPELCRAMRMTIMTMKSHHSEFNFPTEGKAYTEDGDLVYALWIRCQQHLRKEFLSGYVLKAFELASIEETVYYGDQLYIVTFKKAKDAYEVLSRAAHFFGTYRSIYFVTVAHSWQQPYSAELIRRRFEVFEGCMDPDENPICKLNHDCLIHVSQYLGLIDQYHFSRLDSRFENAIKGEFRRKLKHIVVDDFSDFTLLERRQILIEYGHFVETVKMRRLTKQHVLKEFVSLYCPNLKALEMVYCDKCPSQFIENMQHLENIHTLKLIDCVLEDGDLECLSRIRSLEVLDVSQTDSILGLPLCNFENLKELNIEQCYAIEESAFISMCENLPKLTVLNIKECPLSDDAIKSMSSLCRNLRDLTICNRYVSNMKPILQLPNLEKLHLYLFSNVCNDLFEELAQKLRSKLRLLNICVPIMQDEFDQIEITHTQLKCICEVTSLEELYLSGPGITDDFLQRMLSLANLKTFGAFKCPSLTVSAVLGFIRDAPRLEKFELPADWNSGSYHHFILSTDVVLKQRRSNSKYDNAFKLHIKSAIYSSLTEECKEYVRVHRNIVNVVLCFSYKYLYGMNSYFE